MYEPEGCHVVLSVDQRRRNIVIDHARGRGTPQASRENVFVSREDSGTIR